MQNNGTRRTNHKQDTQGNAWLLSLQSIDQNATSAQNWNVKKHRTFNRSLEYYDGPLKLAALTSQLKYPCNRLTLQCHAMATCMNRFTSLLTLSPDMHYNLYLIQLTLSLMKHDLTQSVTGENHSIETYKNPCQTMPRHCTGNLLSYGSSTSIPITQETN
jgi:hypothetical protein